MSDVEFRLTVTRDPRAKQAIAQWQSDLSRAEENYRKTRVQTSKRAHDDINRQRGLAVQAEIQAQRRMEAEARAALNRRLQAYKRAKREEQLTAERTAREIAAREDAIAKAAMQRRLSEARRIAQEQRAASRQGGGGFSGMLGGAGAAGGGFGTGALIGMAARRFAPLAVAAAGYRAVDAYGTHERNRLQMGALFGGEAGADTIIGTQRRLGTIGVDPNVTGNVATMMGGFGMSLEDVNSKLMQFAEITGGNTERLGRLAIQYAQMHSMGRLYTEDMKIMAEAGFNPLTQMAKDTGKSMQELRQMMEKGEISVDMVSKAFENAAKASGRLEAMMGSTSQRMSAAYSDFSIFMVEIGQKLSPVADLLSAGISGVLAPVNQAMSGSAWLDLQGQDQQAITSWQNYMQQGNSGAGFTDADVTRMQGLDRGLEAQRARIKAEEEAVKKQRQEREAMEAEQKRSAQVRAAEELKAAKEVGDFRLKTAKEELQQRERMLDVARKETEEARSRLMSARQRFGLMSEEDQEAAIGTLLKARNQGPGALTLEEINRLQSLGTGEANRLAAAAADMRAGAAFGGGEIRDRRRSAVAGQDALQDRINAIRERRRPTGVGLSRAERDEIRRLEFQQRELNGREQGAERMFAQRSQVRDSIFGDERRAVRQAEFNQQRIEANVSQSIEFVAKFDRNAEMIASEVYRQFNAASETQTKEVLKLLEPLIDDVRALQRRAVQTAGGRRG